MSDDKNKQGRDRELVAGGEEYEVRYFTDKHGISMEQAEKLIAEHGNNREKLDEVAKSLGRDTR